MEYKMLRTLIFLMMLVATATANSNCEEILFVTKPVSVEARIRDTINFTCDIGGDPFLHRTFRLYNLTTGNPRDFNSNADNDEHYERVAVNGIFNTLVVRNVQAVHAGVYACFAQPRGCPRFFSTNASLTIIVICLSLSLGNGIITYNDTTLGLNTVATYSCNVDYILTTSTNTRTCKFNGAWSGAAASCQQASSFVQVRVQSSGTLTAGEKNSLTCSVDVPQSLNATITYEWTRGGTQVGNDSILEFRSLTLLDSGQYACTVNVTSNLLSSPLTVTSDMYIVTIKIPPPNVVVSSSTPVYHGTNHNFTCQASYDIILSIPVTMTYSWTGPNGPLSDSECVTLSLNNSLLTLTPVDHPQLSSGDYTCTVTVQPVDSAFINQSSTSDTINITVLALPPPEVFTGVPEREGRCGRVSSVSCTASVVDNLAVTPSFMWAGPDGITLTTDNTLELTPGSVLVNGEYTCVVCVSVETVGISNLCGNASVSIQKIIPEPVGGLTCTSVPPSTLTVNWSPSTSPVLSYQVEVRRYTVLDQGVNTIPLAFPYDQQHIVTSATINGLESLVRYEVRVEAVSGVDCSTVTSLDCYTEEGAPPVVTGVTTNRLNGTAMSVSWTPLNKAQSNGFIQSYTVTYSKTGNRKRQGPETVTVSGDRSDVIIAGLDPASAYSVSVTASTAGGTSESSPVELTPTLQSALFQLRLTNINNCPDWVDQDRRIGVVTNTFAREVENHCDCGFSESFVSSSIFRCFPDSSTAVTFRATLTDSRFLPNIQNWIQTNGNLPVQNVLISVDDTCQLKISSLADTECTSQPMEGSNVAIIGGVTGGVVIVIIIAITIVIVVVVSMYKRRQKMVISNKTTRRELPAIPLSGVVSTSEIQPYEMIEMGQNVSEFRQVITTSAEYEVVGAPSSDYEAVTYNNNDAIMTEQQTGSPPPSLEQPSGTTEAAGDDIELNECTAYNTTHSHEDNIELSECTAYNTTHSHDDDIELNKCIAYSTTHSHAISTSPSNEQFFSAPFTDPDCENNDAIMAEQQTGSPPPSSEQPSGTTEAAGDDIELNECIAYSLTTHTHAIPPPSSSEQSLDPLCAN